ncbi:unnamed protein product [Clavelina lepadiformis]|uniref:Uncharacterized protein n=1 Tax=Clavelina lepadiformis TaxID=159417 RepID=A0ABP0GA92_CLALP
MYVCEFLCLKKVFFLMWCGSYVTATNADYKDSTPAYSSGEFVPQILLESFQFGMIGLGIAVIVILFVFYRISKQTDRQLRERENQQRNLALRFANGNVVNRSLLVIPSKTRLYTILYYFLMVQQEKPFPSVKMFWL